MTKEALVNKELTTEEVRSYYFSPEMPFSEDQEHDTRIIRVGPSFLLNFSDHEQIGKTYLVFNGIYNSDIPPVNLIHQRRRDNPDQTRSFVWFDTSDISESKVPFYEWEILGFSTRIRAMLQPHLFTIEDLKNNDDHILSTPGLGPAALREIKDTIESFEKSIETLVLAKSMQENPEDLNF